MGRVYVVEFFDLAANSSFPASYNSSGKHYSSTSGYCFTHEQQNQNHDIKIEIIM